MWVSRATPRTRPLTTFETCVFEQRNSFATSFKVSNLFRGSIRVPPADGIRELESAGSASSGSLPYTWHEAAYFSLALHGGYFLRRQLEKSISARRGRPAERFLQRVVDAGHVRSTERSAMRTTATAGLVRTSRSRPTWNATPNAPAMPGATSPTPHRRSSRHSRTRSTSSSIQNRSAFRRGPDR